jgi:hypothetical protein
VNITIKSDTIRISTMEMNINKEIRVDYRGDPEVDLIK